MSRFLLCLIPVLGHPFLAQAHQLPNGEIERRVQVSVKPDCVLVQYSLAMNPATLEKELLKHKLKPADTVPAMWKQYQKIILPSLCKHMRLTIDGDSYPITPIRADFTGFSHRHLTCLLKADIALTKQPKTIIVTDGNLLDAPGDYRIAMKSRSGAKMEKSTVPPIVVRAEPIKLAELTKEQKQAAARAQGEFALKPTR